MKNGTKWGGKDSKHSHSNDKISARIPKKEWRLCINQTSLKMKGEASTLTIPNQGEHPKE